MEPAVWFATGEQREQVVFYVMAGVMVVCYAAAHLWMPRGKAEEPVTAPAARSAELPQQG
jgi:hypothetical protein